MSDFLDIESVLLETDKYLINSYTRLFDQSLKDVDPYSEDLTDKQKKAIIEECKYNPIYFLSKIVKVPTLGESSFHPFEFNIGTFAASIAYMETRVHLWLRLPRQSGQTYVLLCLGVHDFIFNHRWITIISGHHDVDTKMLKKKFKELINTLPDYIKDLPQPTEENCTSETIIVDDAEWISYDFYKEICAKSKRVFFCGVINKYADLLLIREIEMNYFKFNFKDALNMPKNILITYDAKKIFKKERIKTMEIMIDDDSVINRELYLIRC